MAHLEDNLADFFYKELSATEMKDAKQHISECEDCRLRLRQFEKMHIVLRSAPDWDPPRNIVFSEPQRSAWLSWFDWRPLLTSTAAAALVAGIIIRLTPALPPKTAPTPLAAPAIVEAEKVDYNRIVNEVRQSEREWLAGQLQSRDGEIQRLRAEIAYYDSFQRAVMKETLENGSAIQLLAQRTEQR
jgi:hypothetical protein